MRIFGFNISRSRSNAPLSPVTRDVSPAVSEWLRGEDVEGGPVLTNAYQQVVWVYRAINVLAEQVANIPFLFSAGERGRETLITSGPLQDFYARPHPQINRFQYWELRVIWLMLRGECFRVPIYEEGRRERGERRGRRLTGVLVLDPAQFQHIVENHQLIGWRYTGFGPQTPLESQVFLPEEVWFEKLPNPFDFWRGLPPLYAAALAARTDFAASAFMRGVIENNGDTGLIVRTKEPLDPDQQEQLFAKLRDRKRRAGQADKPLLLSGVTEIIKPELSSADLQFLENRKFSRAEICAAFGVPEEIVATSDHNKYDVMQGARQNFIENRVAPLCSRLEAEEEMVVKSLDPAAVGWFDLESLPIMQQARRNRLATAKTGFEMGVPFNELNRVLDLGFKPTPWGNDGYIPANLQRLGGENPKSQMPNPKQIPNTKLQSPAARTGDPIERAMERLDKSPVERMGELLEGLGAESANGQPTTNPQVRSKVRRFLFEQRQRVLHRLNELNGLNGVEGLFDLAAENQELAAVFRAHEPPGSAGFNAGETVVARNTPAGMPALPGARHSVAALRQLNQTTLSALKASLAEGIAKRETGDQLAARVRAIYNRASTIVGDDVRSL
jgi:HK97 family phage portal protein